LTSPECQSISGPAIPASSSSLDNALPLVVAALLRMPMQTRRTTDSRALTTRVPASLRRRLRLYCIECEVMLQDFIREALEEALRKKKRR